MNSRQAGGTISGTTNGNTATITMNLTAVGGYCSGSFTGVAIINTSVTPATMTYNYNGTWSPSSCGVSESGTELLTNRFVDKGNGTIYDAVSNLTWLKSATCFSQQTWENAVTKSSTLSSGQCGLSDGSKSGDWHLPTVDELRIFIDAEMDNDTLNAAGFSSVQLTAYWTNSINNSDKNLSEAWAVWLNGASVQSNEKTRSLYVWPVRVGKP